MSCISCNSVGVIERPPAVSSSILGVGIGVGAPPPPPAPAPSNHFSIPGNILKPNPENTGLFWRNSGRESSPSSPICFIMGERSPSCITSLILPPNTISTGPPLSMVIISPTLPPTA